MMERVQNLAQFLHWLKDRKLKKQEAANRKSGKTKQEVTHVPNCRCRTCMRLPQIPREHRRFQKILQRAADSPDHVYEEIFPDDVVSDNNTTVVPSSCKPNLTLQEESTTAKINELFRANAKAQLKKSENVKSQESTNANKDASVNLGNLDFGQAKEFGGFLVVPLRDRMVFHPVSEQTAKDTLPNQTTVDTDNTAAYVNQEIAPKNLHEFREVMKEHVKVQERNSLPKRLCIKELGGHHMVSKDNLSGPHTQSYDNLSQSVKHTRDNISVPITQSRDSWSGPQTRDTIIQSKDNAPHTQSHENVMESRHVSVHQTQSLDNFSMPFRDAQTVLKCHDDTTLIQQTHVPDVSSHHHKQNTSMNSSLPPPHPETPPPRKPRKSSGKSAFTRYIPTSDAHPKSHSTRTSDGSQVASRNRVRYDPCRGSISTDTSDDSGGYFPPDDSLAQSSSQSETQGSGSDKSNDTYNEYDIQTEEPQYDVFLQKAQQFRGFESHIQAIVKESESEQNGEAKLSADSPLSMLNIDEILALVSSDDHSELLTDIMLNPQSHNIAMIKQRLSPIHHQPISSETSVEDYQLTNNSDLSKHGPTAACKQSHMHELASIPKSSQKSSHSHATDSSKLSCRVTSDPAPSRSAPMHRSKGKSSSNRLLGDLMRANHDRQLLC